MAKVPDQLARLRAEAMIGQLARAAPDFTEMESVAVAALVNKLTRAGVVIMLYPEVSPAPIPGEKLTLIKGKDLLADTREAERYLHCFALRVANSAEMVMSTLQLIKKGSMGPGLMARFVEMLKSMQDERDA